MVEGSSSEATTGKGPTEAVVTRVVAILNSASATIPKSTLPTASGGVDTSPVCPGKRSFGVAERSRKAGVFSGAVKPTGAKVRSPVAWMARGRETELWESIDKAIVRMGSESSGRNGSKGSGDNRVREAHRESVRVALDEMERYAQARIGGNNPAQTTGAWAYARTTASAAARSSMHKRAG